jgi:hypothetical protein
LKSRMYVDCYRAVLCTDAGVKSPGA